MASYTTNGMNTTLPSSQEGGFSGSSHDPAEQTAHKPARNQRYGEPEMPSQRASSNSCNTSNEMLTRIGSSSTVADDTGFTTVAPRVQQLRPAAPAEPAEPLTVVLQMRQEDGSIKNCTFCRKNIRASVAYSKNEKDLFEQLRHDQKDCTHPHFNPKKFGGKHLCADALRQEPCRYAECRNLHPVNYPQIARPTSSGGAVVRSGGGGARAPRPTGNYQPRITNKLLCYKELALSMNVKLNADEEPCAGGCGFAHNVKDQHIPPQVKEFDALVASGQQATLAAVQEWTLEVYKVISSMSPESHARFLEVNTVTQIPDKTQFHLDMLFKQWAKAASNERSNGNPNGLALFEGPDSAKENLVWELCRRMNVCWTSEKHAKQLLGGKNELCCPTKREVGAERVNYRAAREGLETKVAQLQAEHCNLKAIINNKQEEESVRKAASKKGEQVKKDLSTATRALQTAELVPICQGGATCRNGVHKELCGPSGVLAAIDIANFCGRSSSYNNHSDIAKMRADLISRIKKLQREYDSLKDNTSIERGSEKVAYDQRLSGLKQDIALLIEEASKTYNLTRLFPEPGQYKPIIFVPEQQVEAERYIYNAADFNPLEIVQTPEETLEQFVARIRLNVFRQLSHRFNREKQQRVSKYILKCVKKMRGASAKEHHAIAFAPTSEEARKKYESMLLTKSICLLPYDPAVTGRTATRDGRIIFYFTEEQVFVATTVGYKLYTGSILTPVLAARVSSFSQELYRQFFNSGAFTSMSYHNYTHPLTREAWVQFSANPSSQPIGWVAFEKDVSAMRDKWNSLGMVTKKTVTEGAWDKEDPTKNIHIEEVYEGCPEKDLIYADFWGYYFNIPKTSDLKVVGTTQAASVAAESMSLFQEFLTNKSVLIQDKVVTTNTFAEWLTVHPKYTAAFAALNSGSFQGHTFRTICFFVNSVASVSATISIEDFVANEMLVRLWVSCAASRNIGGAFGGVEFSTFATAPFDYHKYYSSFYPTIGRTFAEYMAARADGWDMVKTSTKAIMQQSSLAHLPKEAFADAASIKQHLSLMDSIKFGAKPAKLTINTSSKVLKVTPSIYDIQLCQLAKLLSHNKPNRDAVRAILSKLPTSETQARDERDDVIQTHRNFHQSDIKSVCHELCELLDTLTRCRGISPAMLQSLKTELNTEIVETIRATFPKLTSGNGRIFQTKFNEYIALLTLDIEANIKQFIEETTTDVCPYTDTTGELRQPALIAAALELLAKEEDEEPMLVKRVSTKSAKSTKSTKSKSTKANKFTVPTLVDEELSGEAVFMSRPKKQDNALLLSGRTSVPTGFVLYMTSVKQRFAAKAETKTEAAVNARSITYWHIGPFPDKAAADKVRKALAQKGHLGGITTQAFAENGPTVYEVQMPDLANKVHEKAKKWDWEEAQKLGALATAKQETIQLLHIAADAYGFTEDKVFAPELVKPCARPAPARAAAPVEYESDSEDEDSDSDDSDSEDEVIIGKSVNAKNKF